MNLENFRLLPLGLEYFRLEGGFGLLSKFYICWQKEGFSNNIFSTFKSNIPTQVTSPGAHPDHTKNDLFPLFNLLLVVVDSPHQGLHVHVSYTYIHALLCKLPIQYTSSIPQFFSRCRAKRAVRDARDPDFDPLKGRACLRGG